MQNSRPVNKVVSPITKKENCDLQKTIPSSQLINSYKSSYNIDVTKYFTGLDEIALYKCLDTGYRFFYPLNLAGDSAFYEQLQRYDWYYMPWKWEHSVARKKIKEGNKILEVGCGAGDFVRMLHAEGFDITGLELNENTAKSAVEKGLEVLNETIEKHAGYNSNTYDVVCSFQVLEHIAEIDSFISGCIACLKPGGRLIFCVPNNGSFIRYDKNLLLNMPPHHMGLWDASSLRNLSNYFPINCNKIIHEPLQSYHRDWYFSMKLEELGKNKYFKKLYDKLHLQKFFMAIIKKLSSVIKGHSIMAIYLKDAH